MYQQLIVVIKNNTKIIVATSNTMGFIFDDFDRTAFVAARVFIFILILPDAVVR
tara:strand:- start:173 stop:334 length:162 start_codon:yes stop_codon:yes gene_type:complete